MARTTKPVTLTIGGEVARVFFAGQSPGFAGLYQVNAIVPDGVSGGAEVSVSLSVSGQTSAEVTIGVE